MDETIYRQKKSRNLTDFEKHQIKQRLETGESDRAKLAEASCRVPTQVAGIKAWRKM